MRIPFRLVLLALVVLTLGAIFLFQNASRAQRIQPSVVPPATCTPAPPGMVGWWPGEGNGNDIRGENNGTLQGSPTFPAGEVGQAFGFASNGDVNVPYSESLDPLSGRITVDAWVNSASYQSTASIINKRTGANNTGYTLEYLSNGNGTILWHVFVGGTAVAVVSNAALPLNTWTHVAGTYDGTTSTLYFNGTQVGSTTFAGSIDPSPNAALQIGRNIVLNSLWDGLIDEVEVFDRALTVSEIQNIFDAGTAGKCRPRCVTPPSGMVGWWTGDDNPFDIWSTNHGAFESGPSPSPSPSASPYVDGKVGRAFNFDGSGSYVDLDTYSGFDLTDAITIDAWVRPTGIPSGPVMPNQKGKVNPNQLGGGFEGILTKWQSPQVSDSAQPEQAGDSYGLWLASEQTGASLTLYGAVETDCGANSIFGGTVPLNVWSHVAMTYDSATGTIALYVNGVQVNSDIPDCGVMTSTSTQVNIGCQSCGATQTIDPFTGQIDEVEVFNVALSSSDIEAINNGASAGKCKPCLAPPTGMVGWWNGDANPKDSSPTNNVMAELASGDQPNSANNGVSPLSGNDGTLQGGAGYAFGKVGQAFNLDGSGDYVSVADSPSLRPTNVTIDGWFNFAATPGENHLVAKAAGTGIADSYVLFFNGGVLKAGIGDPTGVDVIASSFSPALNTWYHIAFTFDDANEIDAETLYVNGAVVASGSTTRSIGYDGHAVLIGAESDNETVGFFFSGKIDEVEIFDRALTQTEIQSIVAAGASGKCKSTCDPNIVNTAANSDGNMSSDAPPCNAVVFGNHPEAVESDQIGDATVTGDVSSAGGTDYQTLDIYSAGPMPFGYDTPIEIADISSTTTFNGNVTVCFNLQSVSDATVFNQLRVLHLEGNVLVDRTSSHFFPTRSLCATVPSLSPFVISQNPNAGPTAAPANISGTVTRPDGSALAGVVIELTGDTSRLAITDSNGLYSFSELDTNGFYTVTPALVNYSFTPLQRSLSLLANTTDAVFTGTPNAVVTGSPIDTTGYFVRQHYLDFLNREPDESGFNFWSHNILSCGNDASCLEVKRINTSAAYFLSIEFQQTGYLIYRMYKAAYGDLPGAPVPVRFNEFMPDTREIGQNVIVNRAGWEQTLENNKQAFADAFVARTRFTGTYGAMDDWQFVNTLNQNAGSVLSVAERDELWAALISRRRTRAQVLRIVAENAQLARLEFNRAFVLMQYFGYLRRDANSGPDTDFTGYNFWLNKLNTFGGNFQDAEMVKAFLSSIEYRGRFPR